MSEYWKSTPKYWCKHCSMFVRDTKLEKTNHEASPKHQGNLKRFLRDLHRGHEKDQKDKERAKNEVARLNGMVSGGGSGAEASSSSYNPPAVARPPVPRPLATPSQRKQQLAQLAELGVAVPDEFLPDLAMAGQWQVMSERVLEEDGEKKPEALAVGIRKRAPADDDEEELSGAKRRRWGSTYRNHPGEDDDGDLDSLLSKATEKGKVLKKEDTDEAKPEVMTGGFRSKLVELQEEVTPGSVGETQQEGVIKREPSEGETAVEANLLQIDAPKDSASPIPEIVFKKRKAKNIRQR